MRPTRARTNLRRSSKTDHQPTSLSRDHGPSCDPRQECPAATPPRHSPEALSFTGPKREREPSICPVVQADGIGASSGRVARPGASWAPAADLARPPCCARRSHALHEPDERDLALVPPRPLATLVDVTQNVTYEAEGSPGRDTRTAHESSATGHARPAPVPSDPAPPEGRR